MKKTDIYNEFWLYACERQNIFWKRISNNEGILTDDSILRKYRFTNVYRATDRVSQYLIKNVIYSGNYDGENLLFRILLFKIFNNINTWEFIRDNLDSINYYSFKEKMYVQLLDKLREKGRTLYSGAYIMPPGNIQFGNKKKHENHVALLSYMMKSNLTKKVTCSHGLKELYETLLDYPVLGKFLAYQYSIDINYSELTDFDEMEFVIAGPGAHSGIHKCFSNLGDYSDEDIIRYMTERQEEEFARLDLPFKYLGNRKLQLIDCQNIFCELDKYTRVKYPNVTGVNGRTKIKRVYKRNIKPIDMFYPPKWHIEIG